MPSVHPAALPDDALLRRYRSDDGHVDCYCIDVPRAVSHQAFVSAFYTTPLFKLERALLALLLKRPSTDIEAGGLAAGRLDAFAAWTVEARAPDQLLLRDLAGRTRSWLMVAPRPDGTGSRLYFGSAVVARLDKASGRPHLGATFRALLGFHKLYSRALLAAAAKALKANGSGQGA